MKPVRSLFIILALLLVASFLSGCSSSAYGATSWPGVVIQEQTAYMALNQFVYAINLDNGSQIWTYPAEKADRAKSFYAPPALTPDGQLIVGGYDHKLYSLDSKSGAEKWVFSAAEDRYIASPLVTESGIFAPNADGKLYALDFQGKLRWEFESEHPLWAQPATNEDCGCLYVSSMDHHLYALDAENGNVLWKSVDLGGALVASPTFGADGVLYIGTFANEMLALEAESGSVLWRFTTAGWIWSGVAVDGNRIFFGDLKGNLYALNAETGVKTWQVETKSSIASTPLVIDDLIVYTTENDTVYAMDKDSNPEWSQKLSGNLYAPALSYNNSILITPASSKTMMAALSSEGVVKWIFGEDE